MYVKWLGSGFYIAFVLQMITIIAIGQALFTVHLDLRGERCQTRLAAYMEKNGNLRMNKYQDKSFHLDKSGNEICTISFIHFIHSFPYSGNGS